MGDLLAYCAILLGLLLIVVALIEMIGGLTP